MLSPFMTSLNGQKVPITDFRLQLTSQSRFRDLPRLTLHLSTLIMNRFHNLRVFLGFFDNAESIYDIIKWTGSAYYRLPVAIDVTVKVSRQDLPRLILHLSTLIMNRFLQSCGLFRGFDDAESIYDVIKRTGIVYHRLSVAIDVTVKVTTW